MASNLSYAASSGTLWASIDRFGTMGLQFSVNLLLTRLLIPEDFGIIGLLLVFTTISQVFIDGGFNNAIIQAKEINQKDYSTIFYWNVSIASILYTILYFFSPLISDYFKQPVLSPILRIYGLSLIFGSIVSIQITKLRKSFNFKVIAITNLGSYITASVIAVLLAYNGFGVWSLVVLQISYSVFSIIIYFIFTRWTPSLIFSLKSIKELFRFGSYLLAANILQEICKNFQNFVIGKKFSTIQLGYYSQASKLDQVFSYSIPQVVIQVLYPVYSTVQDNPSKLVEMVSFSIRVIAYLIFPIIFLLILSSGPLITFLYGNKWLECIPFFQILCVGGLFVCLQNINFYAVASVGRSRELFYWSLYKWGALISIILICMDYGIQAILWGIVASNLNIYLTNAYLVSKYIGYTVYNQIKTLLPILGTNVFLYSALLYLMHYKMLSIFMAIPIYIASYIAFSQIILHKPYSDVIRIVKNFKH